MSGKAVWMLDGWVIEDTRYEEEEPEATSLDDVREGHRPVTEYLTTEYGVTEEGSTYRNIIIA